jgi:hypothetical protein
LQQAAALSMNQAQITWVDVPASVSYNNGINEVVLTASAGAEFYRLVSICP